MVSFNDYASVCRYLHESLINTESKHKAGDPTPREWMLRILEEVGNPQKAFPAIHVAGTSGKGSICMMIAQILRAQGLKVGLHTSPYLQTITEKFWVDGSYIDENGLCVLADWIKPVADRYKDTNAPIYRLALFAMVLEHFKRQQVDVAVIETGVGGRDDLTNVLESVTTVVGKIGLDHTNVLGSTIEEIARHKFGIGHKDVPMVYIDSELTPIAEEVAKETGALLEPLYPGRSFERLTDDPQDGRFSYHGILSIENLFPTLDGSFQTGNAALAVAACEQASLMLGKNIGEQAIRMGLIEARLPARLEVMKRRPRVILDGAHNPQKLAATLKVLCADRFRGKLIAVFGLLATKDAEKMAETLSQYCHDAVVTEPVVLGKPAIPANELAKILESKGITVRIEKDPYTALENAIAFSHGDDRILATGSLYMAGQLREHYYPSDKIIDECTSWPH